MSADAINDDKLKLIPEQLLSSKVIGPYLDNLSRSGAVLELTREDNAALHRLDRGVSALLPYSFIRFYKSTLSQQEIAHVEVLPRSIITNLFWSAALRFAGLVEFCNFYTYSHYMYKEDSDGKSVPQKADQLITQRGKEEVDIVTTDQRLARDEMNRYITTALTLWFDANRITPISLTPTQYAYANSSAQRLKPRLPRRELQEILKIYGEELVNPIFWRMAYDRELLVKVQPGARRFKPSEDPEVVSNLDGTLKRYFNTPDLETVQLKLEVFPELITAFRMQIDLLDPFMPKYLTAEFLPKYANNRRVAEGYRLAFWSMAKKYRWLKPSITHHGIRHNRVGSVSPTILSTYKGETTQLCSQYTLTGARASIIVLLTVVGKNRQLAEKVIRYYGFQLPQDIMAKVRAMPVSEHQRQYLYYEAWVSICNNTLLSEI